MTIEYLLIKSEASIKDAVNILEITNEGIALVVNNNKLLLGTITDGDIRRGLLKGLSLNNNVSSIMKKNMIFLRENIPFILKKAESLMKEHNICQIPVLDKKGKILNLITSQDIQNSNTSKIPRVVIMAGGLGSRLLPLTENIPKPMLKFGGKPMLEIVLSSCIRAGLKEFYFAVNHLKEQIIDYFEDGSKWGVSIKYLEEENALGTAGALHLYPNEDESMILVLNGDVLTNLDISNLISFHKKHDSIATICVREHTEKIPYGVVNLSNEIVTSIEEKPSICNYVNAGIYLLNPEILQFIEEGNTLDMPDLLTLAIEANEKVTACPIHEYWVDVGQPETFSKAKKDWATKQIKQ